MEGAGRGPGRRPGPLPCADDDRTRQALVTRAPLASAGTTVAAKPRQRKLRTQGRGTQQGPDHWPRYGRGSIYGTNLNHLPTRLRTRPQQRQDRGRPAIRTQPRVKVIPWECRHRRTAAAFPCHGCAALPANNRSIVQQLTKQSRPTGLRRVPDLQLNSEFNLAKLSWTDHQQAVRGDQRVGPNRNRQAG